MASTDTTFFTNEEGQSLLERFRVSLKNNTQFFDVLVGYFRASGFFEIYRELENVEKIRILVGLNVDQTILDMINQSQKQRATKEIKADYSDIIQREFADSEDSKEFDEWVLKFVEFINAGKLEVRAYAKEQIHAKIYIIRKDPAKQPEYYGSVITGSSNFSLNGFKENIEFNVELKDRRDVEYALSKFEPLREDGVDVTQEFIDTVKNKTHLNDGITPYQLYLKFLYEYFGNLVNQDRYDLEMRNKPDWYQEMEYQKDAVKETLHKIQQYGWVFLADVVWLWKTIVSCLLLQHMKARALIICPPSIKGQWESDLWDFMVGWCKVESLGMLEKLIEEWTDQYEYVFIDEAHRFRNEDNESYGLLTEICQGKKVILVSATPFNNRFDDLKNLIKLFHPLTESNLPGIHNLDAYFNKWMGEIKRYNIEQEREEYLQILKTTSQEMRSRVLQHLMVRRTRSDIVKFYSDDMETQHLSFPEPADPVKVMYELDDDLNTLFDETIKKIKNLSYARYNPVKYLEGWANIKASDLQIQQVWQQNIVWFMKTWLVKRLESSFNAFKNTLGRIKSSYEKFIQMYENWDIYVSKKINVYDLLETDFEKLLELVDNEKVVKYNKDNLTKKRDGHTFIEDLQSDYEILTWLLDAWENVTYDPKIEELANRLQNDPILKQSQVIIFSESKETVDYVAKELQNRLGYTDEVFSFSWEDSWNMREYIRRNFDPKNKNPDNTIKILVTTDVLAEWVNLHKANVIINYDIPWNPTRVLQRFGRVNRIWTKHQSIYIYNFFPTAKGDEHLSLEKNVIAKMNAFISLLGADTKHLTEDVDIESKTLFDKLNSKKYYESEWEGETSSNTTLGYLQQLRIVRDNDSELFETIKRLPKKSRSSRKLSGHSDKLVTFFKKWDYLKIFLSDMIDSQELTFEKAAELLECTPDTPRTKLDMWAFFELLSRNKDWFRGSLFEDEQTESTNKDKGKWSHIRKNILKHFEHLFALWGSSMTDEEETYFEQLRNLISWSILPLPLLRDVGQQFESMDWFENPTRLYYSCKQIIHDNYFVKKSKKTEEDNGIKVILSEYFS